MHVKDTICRFRKSMPICYFGAATDGKMSAPNQLSPFSGHGMSNIIFPVFHPNLAFLYQIDFGQLLLVTIMHEILTTERKTKNNK